MTTNNKLFPRGQIKSQTRPKPSHPENKIKYRKKIVPQSIAFSVAKGIYF